MLRCCLRGAHATRLMPLTASKKKIDIARSPAQPTLSTAFSLATAYFSVIFILLPRYPLRCAAVLPQKQVGAAEETCAHRDMRGNKTPKWRLSTRRQY